MRRISGNNAACIPAYDYGATVFTAAPTRSGITNILLIPYL
ncbi:MAG: hypothetical protein ABIX01_07820 [Chitinophagaceae bacterium]